MPWYKLEVWHGPGHQSKTIEYEWSDNSLNALGKKNLWDDFCDTRNFDYPIPPAGTNGFDVTLVDTLPENFRLHQISSYTARLEHCTHMLTVLGYTPLTFEEWYRNYELINIDARLSEIDPIEALKIAYEAGQRKQKE